MKSKNPQILVVAPSSCPIHGPEANVNSKLIKLLSESGVSIDLISRDPRKSKISYPLTKNDFFFGKVKNIITIRTDTKFDIKTLVKHLRLLIKTGYVYKGADWAYDAIVECERLMKIKKYEFVYTFDYPSEVVGLYLTKKYDVKWVGTWNDPYMLVKYPAPYGKGVESKVGYFRKKIFLDIQAYSYKNIFPSRRLANYITQYIRISVAKCHVSPHLVLNELEVKNSGARTDLLKIIHSGSIGSERNPESFLSGVRLFLNLYPEAKMKVTFLGVTENKNYRFFFDLIRKYNLSEYVEALPPVPYIESLQVIKNYDLCLLIEADCEEGIFLPSKISDYFQNNKPIFGISPANGVINDMFNDNLIDYFGDVRNDIQVSDALAKIYNDYLNDELGIGNKDLSFFRNESVLNFHKETILGVD